MLFLAGDIGGTKALLRLEERSVEGEEPVVLGQRRFLCHQFDSLTSIIIEFLSAFQLSSSIDTACFGLPGPVHSRTVQLTNLPWVVDGEQIEQACSISQVIFINDFFAAAAGVEKLHREDYLPLLVSSSEQEQRSLPSGHRLVIGAGTGLGVAPVFFDGQHYHPLASEGGHFEFAPISDTQQYLLQWLWRRWTHVSYERLLSGPGLETLYQFFQLFDLPNSFTIDKGDKISKNTLTGGDYQTGLNFAESESQTACKAYTAVQIHQAAERGEPQAVKALTEFVTIYGAFVGAAALLWNAPGGIFLAGGIAEKIVPWMRQAYFATAYAEKGRMSKLTASMPVYLITDPDLGVKGAMHCALIRE